MAKLDPRFLNILLRDMPYDEATTLGTVLANMAGSSGNASYGCWLTYTSARAITVNQGALDIFGVSHTVPTTVVDIYDDFGDAGSPLVNTIYYVYAATENGVLNFYFSASKPTRPGYSDTSLSLMLRNTPLQHPAHANWRYIGQVLFRTDATILPFTACTPAYWEGSWNSVSGSKVDVTVPHAWGAVPQDIDYFFNTTAALTNLLGTPNYVGIGNKIYGVLPSVATDKYVIVTTAKDATFWNNTTEAWVKAGYVKAVIWR